MNKLSLRDVCRHLEQLIAAVPGMEGFFENDNEAASFVNKLRRLLDLVQETGTAEPGLKALRETLFPGTKEDSRRVLFSNFRKTLAWAASSIGKNLSLVQPNLRGKELDEVLCWFEGDGFPAEPEIDAATRRSIAGLDRSTLIQAPAAMMTGATLTKITENLREKDDRGRQRIRLFISYAHKNDALASKCLNLLRDELLISKRYDFRIWQDTRLLVGNEWHQDIQQALRECDLCLALCSPAFFASEYITRDELPLIVKGTLPGVPVLLEPVDFKRHDLHGTEELQFYSLNETGRQRAYSECTGEVAKRFVRGMATKIEERIPSAINEVTRRTITQALSDTETWTAFVQDHPEIGEILRTTSPKDRKVSTTAPKASRESFDRLLRHLLPEKPEKLIDAVCAGGGLRELSRQVQRSNEDLEHEDPYERFRSNQHNAVRYLMDWVRDPEGAPFAAVLGEIGSGKTTTLKMLTSALVAADDSPPVIFIDLRDYFSAAEPKLEDLLTEHLRRYDDEKSLSIAELLNAVREQNGLIIFDGLDEKIISLSEAARQNFIRELWRILPAEVIDRPASEGRGKLIISCRSHYFPSVQTQSSGYLAHDRGSITANDYLACIMLPWQDEQIREYLAGCVGEDKVEMALELIEAIHNLKDLSSRPYLLNLIAPELEALEKERASGRPINAASLYHQFIERWLARDEGKHVFTPVHKRRLMEQLAANLWRDLAREWPWERVEEWLDEFLYSHPAMADGYRDYPRAVLKQDFRTATMFLRPDGAANAFRFAHTSLQEYFLASHLARSLYTGDSLNQKTWDLPKPSEETFEFTGQLLQLLPKGDRELAMERLKELLGNAEATVAARTAALEYFVIALKENFSVPDRPDLEMKGVDITAWHIDAKTLGTVSLGSVNFSGATLIRTRIEGVAFPNGSSFRGADLRGSKWVDCELIGVDFTGAILEGSWFRNCDLRHAITIGTNATQTLQHLTKISKPSPWGELPEPNHITASVQLGHYLGISSFDISQDGRIILTGSGDGYLKLWDFVSGSCLKTFAGSNGPVRTASISPDGSLVASVMYDSKVRIWDPKSGNCLYSLKGHSGGVLSVVFSHNSKYLVTSSADAEIKVWDIQTRACIKSFTDISNLVFCARISPDCKTVITSSSDNLLKLWDIDQGQCIRIFKGHSEWVGVVDFSPNGELAISGSGDGTLKLWKLSDGACLNTIKTNNTVIVSVMFSHDGLSILVGSGDGSAKLLDPFNGRQIKTILQQSDSRVKAIFSRDSRVVLCDTSDRILQLRDAESGMILRTFGGAFSSEWEFFLDDDIPSIVGHDDLGNSVRWSFEGKILPPEGGSSYLDDLLVCSQIGDLNLELIAGSTIRLSKNNRLLREIIPLPDGKALVLEPWDEAESLKQPHECRWKLVRGPADAWRYAVAVDPVTLEVHPPEYATENGTWEII